MSTIEHTIPTSIVMAAPATIGVDRVVNDSISDFGHEGAPLSWESVNRSTYDFTPNIFGPSFADRMGKVEEWNALMRDIKLGAEPVWIPDVLTMTHKDLLCGPPGDGTRTTFPISCQSPTVLAVMAGEPGAGIWQPSSGYTIHQKSNLLSNDQYNASDSVTDSLAYGVCVITRDTGVAITGRTSFRVTPTGAQANVGVDTTAAGLAAVTTGKIYTARSHFRGVGDFYVAIAWFTAAKAPIAASTITSDPVTGDGMAVVTTKISGTAPATAAFASVISYRSTNSALVFFTGARMLSPGDYDRSHLPAQCTGLIEYATAPAAGITTTATATGKKLARCYMNKKGSHSFKIQQAAIIRMNSISFTERAEGSW